MIGFTKSCKGLEWLIGTVLGLIQSRQGMQCHRQGVYIKINATKKGGKVFFPLYFFVAMVYNVLCINIYRILP